MNQIFEALDFVENPLYEQLLVDGQIALREGFDPGFYFS